MLHRLLAFIAGIGLHSLTASAMLRVVDKNLNVGIFSESNGEIVYRLCRTKDSSIPDCETPVHHRAVNHYFANLMLLYGVPSAHAGEDGLTVIVRRIRSLRELLAASDDETTRIRVMEEIFDLIGQRATIEDFTGSLRSVIQNPEIKTLFIENDQAASLYESLLDGFDLIWQNPQFGINYRFPVQPKEICTSWDCIKRSYGRHWQVVSYRYEGSVPRVYQRFTLRGLAADPVEFTQPDLNSERRVLTHTIHFENPYVSQPAEFGVYSWGLNSRFLFVIVAFTFRRADKDSTTYNIETALTNSQRLETRLFCSSQYLPISLVRDFLNTIGQDRS